MKPSVLFLFFLTLGNLTPAIHTLQAQITVNNDFTQQDLVNLGSLSPYSPGVRGFDNRYEGVKGSPYWYEDWQNGYIVVQDKGKISQPVSLQLDQYNRTLYFRIEGKTSGYLPAKQIQSVELENGDFWGSFPESLVESQKSDKWKFYRVLHRGNFTLLKSGDKILKKADYQGAYSPDRRYDEFISEESYYFSADNKTFEKIRLRKKTIIKIFPDREVQINNLLRKNDWDSETESGFVALLKALETK